MEPLFHTQYGSALAQLPAPIRRVHDVRDPCVWTGEAQSAWGSSLAAQALCRLLSFPPPGENIPLVVHMRRIASGEVWRRAFGSHVMATRLRPGRERGTVEERLWPFTATFRLDADEKGVSQQVIGLRCLGIRLPAVLWPKFDVRGGAAGARYTFSISVALPWGAPLVHYSGWLETDPADS